MSKFRETLQETNIEQGLNPVRCFCLPIFRQVHVCEGLSPCYVKGLATSEFRMPGMGSLKAEGCGSATSQGYEEARLSSFLSAVDARYSKVRPPRSRWGLSNLCMYVSKWILLGDRNPERIGEAGRGLRLQRHILSAPTRQG